MPYPKTVNPLVRNTIRTQALLLLITPHLLSPVTTLSLGVKFRKAAGSKSKCLCNLFNILTLFVHKG